MYERIPGRINEQTINSCKNHWAVKSKKKDDERCLLPEGLLPSGIQQGKLKVDILVAQEEIQAAATLTTPTEWSERAQKS